MKKVVASLLAGCLLCIPYLTFAKSKRELKKPFGITEEERILQEAKRGKELFPVGGYFYLTQSIGAATFNENPYTRRQSYTVTLTVSPYLRITPLLRLSATISASKALLENYETITTYRHQTFLSDLNLALRHARLFTIPYVGIGVRGELSVALPTSPQSQFRDLYCSTKASIGFTKMVGPLYFSYTFSFFKNFNRYTSPTISKEEVGRNVVFAHYKGVEQLTTDLVAVGGNNVSFGIVNMLLASWNITDELSLSIAYMLNNSWTYRSYPKDEYSSEYATEGRGQRDTQSGTVELGYQLNRHIALALGVQTMVLPKTADNRSFIFPFMNFHSYYRSNTEIYLQLAAMF